MNKIHETILQDAFVRMSESSTRIPIITNTGTVHIKRDILCFFSSFMSSMINSAPIDTAIIVPDITSANMEHLVEILEHGAADISVDERRTYFDIVEEAQEMGIHLDNVSIFKKRLGAVKIEISKNMEEAPLNADSDIIKADQETIKDEGLTNNEYEGSTVHQMDEKLKSNNAVSNNLEETILDEVKYSTFYHKGNESQMVELVNEIRKDEPISDARPSFPVTLDFRQGSDYGPVKYERNNYNYINEKKMLEKYCKMKDNRYQCKTCEKTQKSKHGLLKHVEAKHEGIRYPCSQCTFKASRKETLKKHRRFIHDKIGEDCTICDTKHASKHHLKIHIEVKHSGIKHSCSQCSFQTSLKYSLTTHVLNVHASNKELFACNRCGNEYSSKNRVQQHIATKHDGIRYPCEECHFTGSEPKSLKQHVKTIHENIRISCDFCESTHATKNHLKLHVQSKHEGIRYPCSLCSFQGASTYSVKQHVNNMHSKGTK